MAPYLAAGIAPLGLIVLAQGVVVYTLPESFVFDETWPQNFALLFEVVATALAVADRFIRIRRERDQALSAARDLAMLTEHDELTGLRNRRALETNFHQLVDEGFHSLAVLDLDQFKPINDDYGHPVGDRVIQSAAWALNPGEDGDVAAFRLGGEEFLVLLRGADAADKAEDLRRTVTKRIMASVDVVERPVTASMGYVDFAPIADAARLTLSTLYAVADALLYDAKCAGRNSTRGKTLQNLPERRESDRRRAAA